MKTTLDTGVSLVRNVGRFNFGAGALSELAQHVQHRRDNAHAQGAPGAVVYFVDEFFRAKSQTMTRLAAQTGDHVEFVPTAVEPTTEFIDDLTRTLIADGHTRPATVVGIGGGITMDTTKAVANLLTNGGKAEDYQGWDLVKVPGIHKIGVPTISGTGAEATRTCVLTNTRSGLKLGMNSDHTVFDQVILDPELTATVPREQYFFTGMDSYIHCVESLSGSYRNAIGDAYAREALRLCREVFLSQDMMSAESRERLMVASYLGGCAIATSYVGVVHPLSAGLSVVLHLHHCVANCIVMRAMEEFYPEAHSEFWSVAEAQGVKVPSGIARDLTADQRQAIYDASIMHAKPLTNALGPRFRDVLSADKVSALLDLM
jgi:3-deoxy-alpha-D-manno-octulosonate 8-oxidase